MTDTIEDSQPPAPAASVPNSGQRRWLAPAALLTAVVAVALAVWALATSSPSKDADVATLPGDAKMRVCAAFTTVSQAVQLQTHADLGAGPIPQAAVAGNARLALLGGGQYLLGQLDASTPPELVDAVRVFAHDIQGIGINALAGLPNSDAAQADRLRLAEENRRNIVDLCE